MFKRILVPLDGSEMAEQALPYAKSLAEQYKAELLLVRAIPEPLRPAAPLNMAAEVDEEEDEATAYLKRIQHRFSGSGLHVITKRPIADNATEAILKVATEEQADLIVGVTSGRAGIARTIFGSTIDDLVRDPRQPVLVIKGEGEDGK